MGQFGHPSAARVLPRWHRFQMCRIHARRNSTEMVQMIAARDGADFEQISDSMCNARVFMAKRAISEGTLSAFPDPTGIGFSNLFPKPLLNGAARIVGRSMCAHSAVVHITEPFAVPPPLTAINRTQVISLPITQPLSVMNRTETSRLWFLSTDGTCRLGFGPSSARALVCRAMATTQNVMAMAKALTVIWDFAARNGAGGAHAYLNSGVCPIVAHKGV